MRVSYEMAEIVAEMAAAAVGNPLNGSSDEEDEKADHSSEEKLAMPDFFVGLRPLLMNERAENRFFVRMSPWLALVGTFGMPAYAAYAGTTPLGETPMELVRFGLMGFVFCGGSFYIPLLCIAIRPESGALARLSDDTAGEKLVTKRQINSLKFWRVLLMIPAAIIAIFGIVEPGQYMLPITLFYVGIADVDAKMEAEIASMKLHAAVPFFPSVLFSLVVGYPLAIAWYFSMRVGVQLAQDEVIAVVDNTTREVRTDFAESSIFSSSNSLFASSTSQ